MNLRVHSSLPLNKARVHSGASELILIVVALGFTSIITQIILLREFLGVLSGNELTIGIIFATWMLLTGLGALAGRRLHVLAENPQLPARVLLLVSVLPFVTAFLIRVLRNTLFTPGSMISLDQALLSSLIVLAPFCLLSGFSFSLMVGAFSKDEGKSSIASVYTWESIGGVVGGFGVNILLATLLNALHVLLILLIADCLLVMVIAHRRRQRFVRGIAGALSILAVVAVFVGGLEPLTRALLFPQQQIFESRDTPYGNLTVTRQGEQLNVFENALLLSSSNDVTSDEESVHYAMLQHPAPGTVLVIGGAITGMIGEVLKYHVHRVDCVEINPWLIELGRIVTPSLRDIRVQLINADARRYVGTTGESYDVILLNLPGPGTAQINRFYTLEFFRQIRRIMRDSAVVGTCLLPATEYQGHEARDVTSVLFKTLRAVFPHVLIIPGERNFFIASDRVVDINIGRLVDQRGIATSYVNRYYLDDALLAERSRQITSSLDTASIINTDFHPVSSYHQVAYWLSFFGYNALWIVLVLVALFVLTFWRAGIVGIGVFVGGFSGLSLEIVLLVTFQIFCGSMYQMTGIVVTVFMVGLAVGASFTRLGVRHVGLGVFGIVQFMLAGVSVILPMLMRFMAGMNLSLIALQAIFSAAALLISILVGMVFTVASIVRSGPVIAVASELYGLDLLGSAIGALVVSVYCIPLLGMQNSCIGIGMLSAASGAMSLVARIARSMQPA